MRKTPAAVAALALTLTGCSSGHPVEPPPPSVPAVSSAPSSTAPTRAATPAPTRTHRTPVTRRPTPSVSSHRPRKLPAVGATCDPARLGDKAVTADGTEVQCTHGDAGDQPRWYVLR
jgi:hypothetical protein